MADEAASASPTLLLSLPEAALREIVSWSPDSVTANALLGTCTSLHQLRCDPTTVALLLTRCPWRPDSLNASTALATSSSTCRGCAAAVVEQVLQLLHAGPDRGGPHAAPQRLLDSMLRSAALAGDVHTIHALMALPHPPAINAHRGLALESAISAGPHLAAVEALLQCGADPCINYMTHWAAETHGLEAALPLLLSHCLPARRADAAAGAVESAVHFDNVAAVRTILPLGLTSGMDFDLPVFHAASEGGAEMLGVLLDHHPLGVADLSVALTMAALQGRVACAALLLDRGADVHHEDDLSLLRSVTGVVPIDLEQQLQMMSLLLTRGATVTPAVREAAAQAGSSRVGLLIQQHVAAGG